jgi:hypothetical protein
VVGLLATAVQWFVKYGRDGVVVSPFEINTVGYE